MSRTTTALKRLAVPGLAAVTLIAGIPVLAATSASAAPGDTITMSPETDSASTGTCNVFTVTVKNSAGQPATSTVDVSITERSTAAVETADATFCTTQADGSQPNGAPGDGFTPFAGDAPSGPTAISSTDTRDRTRAEFTPNSDGVVTFGVSSDEPQVLDIRSWIEEDDNDLYNEGETTDTSVKTFTQGGQDAITVVDAEPEAAEQIAGEGTNFTVTATNAEGDTVANAPIDFTVISGPNAGISQDCGVTNNNGIATCTYTATNTGTDTLRVFADESGRRADTFDTGEPFDDITRTVVAAPSGLTIVVTCDDAAGAGFDTCTNDPSDATGNFTATVTDSSGVAQAGILVRTALLSDDDPGVNGADEATVAPAEGRTDSNGKLAITVTDPTPADTETIVFSATIAGQVGGNNTDTGTLEYNEATAGEGRFVDLTPEAGDFVAGSEVTASVTDRFGNPVSGVTVTFTEVGDGNFGGTSSATAVTNAQGTASATLSGGTSGTSTVTASIPSNAECGDTAEAATTTSPAVAAGNCTDTEQYTLTAAASPSPGAESPSPSPAPTECDVTPTVTLEFGTINATGSSGVTVDAPANSQIELLAYSQPSTTYRVVRTATIDNDGNPAQFRIVPPTNTRLFAQIVGCDTDEVRFSKVLNVRTQLSLNVERLGTQRYRFFGDSLPARAGGLIVSLYRITDNGRQVLTAQDRANALGQARSGEWSIDRTFTGTGRFGFVVRTGQDLQNAPGSSNVRSLLIF